MRLRRSRLITPVVLGVAVVTFAALAASSHGFPVQHVSLNDGGIWVTNNSIGTVGRFTKPIGQLDGELAPPSESTSVDVWQNGPVVAAYDASGGRIYAVNVYGTAFYDAGAAISPAPGGIALGDETVAVLSTDHSLRATALSAGGGSLAALSASAKPLAAHLPADSAVSVGSDDTVWLARGGQLRSYPRGGKPRSTALPLSATDPMQVTTVGDVPVVADTTTKTIYLPDSGHTVTLPSSDTSTSFELQQPSAASGVVVAATTQALYRVDLGSGQLTTLSSGHSGSVAAPVQVAGCVHAAWANGATGSYVRTCGTPPPAVSTAASASNSTVSSVSTVQQFSLDDTTGAPVLVFRVNNGTLVLNDTTDGGVFLIDSNVTNVRPKWTPVNTAGNSSNQAQTFQVQEKTQLTAKPYTQGVRPGTTTVVHVLDVDKGPPGTYAVSAVGQPDQPGVTVAVAPDAQTVLATVTSLPADAHFQYTIDDGHGHTASNEVTLEPRAQGENTAPALRPGYQPPSLSVASGGTLVIPVIGDWRDFDGDPLYIDSGAVTSSAGSAAVTSGGALSFTAPQSASGETVRISYGVSDGRVTTPTKATLTVNVLGASSTRFVAPVAEPDAAQAVVGAPVTLQPLANDLPGVDPTNPSAQLTLAAPVPAVTGASVSTDMATGTVAFTAQHPGDFFLTYTDAYGAAPTASGTIRVHVIAASGTPKPPVTTPDVAVLHGQQAAVVDVLADDYDPQGWILGVTSAEPAANSDNGAGLQVAVIDQRWLRISADNPQPGMTATVDYTVSDGKGSATGTVAVSAVAGDLNADQITTTAAAVTIRSGDSAAVPVLAGDASSIGLPLAFSGVPPAAQPAGRRADRQRRRREPARRRARWHQVRGRDDRQLRRDRRERRHRDRTARRHDRAAAVEDPPGPGARPRGSGHAGNGRRRRRHPGPRSAGSIPDGDSVTVTGVTVPPTLGRIVAVGPDTISYQSYPNSTGTDTFTYQVTDPYGLTGTATVRIAVLPPGPPQPPVAADDVINAPPGASLHWNVLGNDFIAPGDTVTVEPLSKTNSAVPAGVTLNGSYVYSEGPGRAVRPARPVHLRRYRRRHPVARPGHRARGARCQGAADRQRRRRAGAGGGGRQRNGRRAQERRRPARVRRRPEDRLGACRCHRARPEPDDQARSAAPRGALPGHRARRAHRDRRGVRAGHAIDRDQGPLRGADRAQGERLEHRAAELRARGHLRPPAQDHDGQPAQRLARRRPHGERQPGERVPGARARFLHRPRRGHCPGLRRRDDAGPARQHGHADDPRAGRPRRAHPALPAGPDPGRRGRRRR